MHACFKKTLIWSLCGVYSIVINAQIIPTAKTMPRITQVNVRVLPGRDSSFTTTIALNVGSQDLVKWQLGFYWLKLLQNPAVHLTIKLCDSPINLNCTPMQLLIESAPRSLENVRRPDLASGHLAILQPIPSYKLQKDKVYTINIEGLRKPPQNISAMPQSFFLLIGHQVVPLKTESYNLVPYNESEVIRQENLQILQRYVKESSIFSTPIVPKPRKLSYQGSWFMFESTIALNNHLSDTAYMFNHLRLLQNDLDRDLGIKINKGSSSSINAFNCNDYEEVCKELNKNPEGYVLQIKAHVINIYAYTTTGFFYATQSLDHLWNYYGKRLPRQRIIDYPQYRYRGIMIDTVRHFFTVAEIRQLLDVMAAQKLNTLHLHLADDEGWRVALTGFPELTENSSRRYQGHNLGPSNLIDPEHDISNISHQPYETAATVYSGYYTVANILDLLSYANSLGITVIPEIEMPGHARALKKALPAELYDFNQIIPFSSVQGYNDNVLPVYKYDQDEKFTKIIDQLIVKIANLFSGQSTIYAYSHELSLAGDEVPKNAYPNIENAAALNHKFFVNLADDLPDYKISGWQQLVQNDAGSIDDEVLQPKQIGHIWLWLPVSSVPISGITMAQNLLDKKYPLVAAFADYAYLDMRYSQRFYEPGLYWASPTVDTWRAFNLGKQIESLAGNDNLQGVEGALWTELIPGKDHFWYMLLPKMTGIAEAGWSDPQSDSWPEFAKRLGCGNHGFLAYLHKNYQVAYRGFPNGIAPEVPVEVCTRP